MVVGTVFTFEWNVPPLAMASHFFVNAIYILETGETRRAHLCGERGIPSFFLSLTH